MIYNLVDLPELAGLNSSGNLSHRCAISVKGRLCSSWQLVGGSGVGTRRGSNSATAPHRAAPHALVRTSSSFPFSGRRCCTPARV